jgi:PEGA domain
MRTALLILSLSLAGCAHRVRVESVPAGATVWINEKMVGVTPMERTLVWNPLRRLRDVTATVSLDGYRSVPIDLSNRVTMRRIWRDLIGRKLRRTEPRFTHTVRLIDEHGPTGTWTREDALQD